VTGNSVAGAGVDVGRLDVPLSWRELFKRTAKETSEDDCFGLAAQLAYYFFLALFPPILFLLALASFFPVANFTDEVVRALRPIAPAEILAFLEDQLRRISNADTRVRTRSSAGSRRTQRFLAGGLCAAIACSSAWRRAAVSSVLRPPATRNTLGHPF
jgi:uncharacterized BrkB/YihY/UPF0761 family membrane protein